jgi:hypothetical protein
MEIERTEYPNSPDRAHTLRLLEAEIASVADTQKWSKERAAKELEAEIAQLPPLPHARRSFATFHQEGARILFREYEIVDGNRSKAPTRLTLYDGRESYVIAGGVLLKRWRIQPLSGLHDLPRLRLEPGNQTSPSERWSYDTYTLIDGVKIPTQFRQEHYAVDPRKPWKEVRYRILPSRPPAATEADFDIHHHAKEVKIVDMSEGACSLGSLYYYDPLRASFDGLRRAG